MHFFLSLSAGLRELMAPQALQGIGAAAGRSLQHEFDGTVACLRGTITGYSDALATLERLRDTVLRDTLSNYDRPASEVVEDVKRLLQLHVAVARPALGGVAKEEEFSSFAGPEADNAAGEALHSSLSDFDDTFAPVGRYLARAQAEVEMLKGRLESWEELVCTHQSPSRVMKWAVT